ncbi:MAG: sugar nucleotide-binding protein [Gammaproteobacteria bacterium]|nr:sugar nucleotide-binding protein [Gammaproteobacteria bacterium]
MKKALILGIGGTFGGHVAKALAQQGWQVKAMVRNPDKCKASITGMQICRGDAANIEDVRAAASGVSLIVYGVNPPNYDWDNKALPWIDVTATVAEEQGLTVVFPGNVYVLNPAHGPVFEESAAMDPVTTLGKTRLAMEQRLQRAAENGAQVIIMRAGDFIAPGARSSWTQHLFRQNKKGVTISAPGDASLPHTWAYVPDLAHTIAALVDKSDALETFNVFHYKGYRASINDMAEAITLATGLLVKVTGYPWWLMKVFSYFSVMFRGVMEMSYLWREEVSLCDDKLRDSLGFAPTTTPLVQALIESKLIRDMGVQQGAWSNAKH